MVIGSVFEEVSTLSRLSLILQRTIAEMAKRPLPSSLPEHRTSIEIVVPDWFARHGDLSQVWEAVETLTGKDRMLPDESALFEVLKRYGAIEHDRFLLIRIGELPRKKGQYALEGYRLLQYNGDAIAASPFSVPFSISDRSRQEIENQLAILISRLIADVQYMIPDLGSLGFAHIEGGCLPMKLDRKRECLGDFMLGRFPVTRAQWQRIMKAKGDADIEPNDLPMVQVSWNDVQHFLKRLNDITGRTYRLPTEAEWEYACKNMGKIADNPYWQPMSPLLANYVVNDQWRGLSSSGQYPQTPVGLWDMVGNIWEWTRSRSLGKEERNIASRYLSELDDHKEYIVKGGSFDSLASEVNCNSKNAVLATVGAADIGFRLVLEK